MGHADPANSIAAQLCHFALDLMSTPVPTLGDRTEPVVWSADKVMGVMPKAMGLVVGTSLGSLNGYGEDMSCPQGQGALAGQEQGPLEMLREQLWWP